MGVSWRNRAGARAAARHRCRRRRAPRAADALLVASDLAGSKLTAQTPAAWVAGFPKAVRTAARGRAAQVLVAVTRPTKTLIVSRSVAFASKKAAASALSALSRPPPITTDASALGVTAPQAAAAGRLTWLEGSVVAQLVYLASDGGFGPDDASALAARVHTRVQIAIEQTGWQQLLVRASTGPGVSKALALQAFALAIGPLPGVHISRAGVGTISSADPAIDWLFAYWKQLTPAQRRAATTDLGIGRPRATPKGHRTTAAVADTTFYPTLGKGPVELKALSRTADGYAKEFAALLHLTPTFKSFVFKQVFAFGRLGRLAASYGFDRNDDVEGVPIRCAIQLNPWRISDSTLPEALAHEVFHCFQMQIIGSMLAFTPVSKKEPWLTEGGAVWATCEVQGGPVGQDWYQGDLKAHLTGLSERTYDAIGFFSELSQATGTSPFSTMADALRAGSSNASYQKLAGSSEAQLLDGWGASLAQDQTRGEAWKMSGPCYKPLAIEPDPMPMSPTSTREAESLPLATTLRKLTFAPGNYVITIDVTAGHGRFSATGIDDVITPASGARSYCVGTCSCAPTNADGSAPKTLYTGDDPPLLALAGGLEAGEATVTGSVVASCPSKIHVVITGSAMGSEADDQGHTHSISMDWHEESDGFITDQLLFGDASTGGLIPLHDDTTKDSLTGNADESFENCHGALTMVPHGLFDPSVRLNPDPGTAGKFVKQGTLTWFLPIRTASWATPQTGVGCVSHADFFLGPGASVMPGTAVDLAAVGTKTYSNAGSIPVSGSGSLTWVLVISVTVGAPGA